MGNACYYSLKQMLLSRLLSKKLKVNIYKLHFILHGCETWSFSLREEQRLKTFENKVLLTNIFGDHHQSVLPKDR